MMFYRINYILWLSRDVGTEAKASGYWESKREVRDVSQVPRVACAGTYRLLS